IPAIVSFPGRFPQDESRDQFCTCCDWFPTITELCEVELPDRTIDGKDIIPVIESLNAESPHEVWHWQLREQWAVRSGDWKLLMDVRDTTDGRHRDRRIPGPFLANLAKDPGERINYAGDQPEVVERLTRLHEQWVKDME
ncbi:MAG TPA: sulfatase, partial [bacterium]|nr:sulfatase [bacterium]